MSEERCRPDDQDAEWRAFFDGEVQDFWRKNVTSHDFTGVDNCKLHYSLCVPAASRKLLLVSPGRIEATIKYQEFVWECAQRGIATAVLDHRGQGESGRLTSNPHQGHVEHFSHFVDDLASFHKRVSAQCPEHQQWLFGHSMGGAIATLFAAEHQPSIQGLILSSPMFSIHSGMVPEALAHGAVTLGWRLNRWFAKHTPWYFPGMGNYQPVAFERNVLTHSQARYRAFRDIYAKHPEVQLGGPTFGWLVEALKAANRACACAPQITVPITLVQAGGDQVVSSHGQEQFVDSWKNSHHRFLKIDGARHELVMESDHYREPLMQALWQQLLVK